MAFTLEEIVPWGRSYTEYVDMFALSSSDLTKTLLGCGDGPAAFNAVLSQSGGNIISVDPLYEFDATAIAERIDETFPVVLEQVRLNQHEFVWHTLSSVDELGKIRRNAMDMFLTDYPQGLADGRYRCESLPTLDFKNQTFELALCSHLLFLYSEQLSLDFHLAAIHELCRVATEVRIFPLLELGTKPSRHLPEVLSYLAKAGYQTECVTVAYEFQQSGNQMLVIKPVFKENTYANL